MKHLIFISGLFTMLSAPFVYADNVASDGISFDLSAGASMMSTKLEGEGFAGELPSKTGMNYGAILSRGWAQKGFQVSLKYNTSSFNFDGPSTVTPRKIGVTRNEYSVLIMTNPTSESVLGSFRYGVGYNLVQYSVDRNTPALVTDQTTYGLSLHVGRDFKLSEKFYTAVDFTLYAPNNLSEGSIPSGFNGRFLGLELGFQVNYKLQEDMALYLGCDYRQEKASFTGTGSRGTTGAKDTRTIISFPIGLRWDFF